MGILFFIAFLVLFYLYMTELVIPWYNKRTFIKRAIKESEKFKDAPVNPLWYLPYVRKYDVPYAKQIKITTTNLPQVSVTLPMGSVTATDTVAITRPVLLVSKQDDFRIYYPDNSVEYLSVNTKKWEKVQTTYNSVYEYAIRTRCIIVENL